MSDESVQSLLDDFTQAHSHVDANACLGEPVEADGTTYLPISEVTIQSDVDIEGTVSGAEPQGHVAAHVRPLAMLDLSGGRSRLRPVAVGRAARLVWLAAAIWLGAWLIGIILRFARMSRPSERAL